MLPVAALIVGLGIGAGAGAGGAGSDSKPQATKTISTTATATATATIQAHDTVTAHPVIKKVIATHTKVRTETYTPPPKPSFGDGKYAVGSDIKPGTFRTSGGSDCYYEIDRGLNGGSISNIVDNENFSGPEIVHLEDGQYFEVSGGCEWRHE